MRIMAHLAAFHSDRRVFECEGATFVGMAFDAGFFISKGLIH